MNRATELLRSVVRSGCMGPQHATLALRSATDQPLATALHLSRYRYAKELLVDCALVVL